MGEAKDNQSINEWAAEHFDRVPGYLNTATAGLPALESLAAHRAALDVWQAGALDAKAFDIDVERCRSAYADLVGAPVASVGIASQTSVITGSVAASLPDGATVLVADEDFTSLLFPFYADDRIAVRSVPLEQVVDSIDADVDLVAVSAVQSSDGRLVDLDGLEAAAHRFDVRTYIDATQAAGWIDLAADRFDVTACHGYKWLCSPRGAAFMTVNERGRSWLKPINAGWYAGQDVWESIYGAPLRLAVDARRYDVSPAWFCFAGAAPVLELLASRGAKSIGEYSIGLANRFRDLVGQEASNSAIVALDASAEELNAAGIRAAGRAGRARLSFYVYNTKEDVELAAEVCLRT